MFTSFARSLSVTALVFFVSAAGCSSPDSSDANGEEGATSTDDADLTGVEDVKQYDGCKAGHGVPVGPLQLGNIGDRDPGTGAMFSTVDCIVGRLAKFRGVRRPYNIQSFKRTPAGQTFIFKRGSSEIFVPNEAPPECLKVKLSAVVGATDVFVTIQRVKQLPLPRADGMCADNGET